MKYLIRFFVGLIVCIASLVGIVGVAFLITPFFQKHQELLDAIMSCALVIAVILLLIHAYKIGKEIIK